MGSIIADGFLRSEAAEFQFDGEGEKFMSVGFVEIMV